MNAHPGRHQYVEGRTPPAFRAPPDPYMKRATRPRADDRTQLFDPPPTVIPIHALAKTANDAGSVAAATRIGRATVVRPAPAPDPAPAAPAGEPNDWDPDDYPRWPLVLAAIFCGLCALFAGYAVGQWIELDHRVTQLEQPTQQTTPTPHASSPK